MKWMNVAVTSTLYSENIRFESRPHSSVVSAFATFYVSLSLLKERYRVFVILSWHIAGMLKCSPTASFRKLSRYSFTFLLPFDSVNLCSI